MKKIGVKSYLRLFGILLLAYILYTSDLKELWSVIKNTKGWFILLSCILLIILYVLKSLRWQNLLFNQGIKYSFKNSFLVYLASNYVAFITPGRIGEAIKAVYLKDDLKIGYSKSFPTVVIDRFFDMYFLLMVSMTGIFQFSIFKQFTVISWIIILLIVLFPWLLFNKKFTEFFIRFLFFPFVNLKKKSLSFYGEFIKESKSILGLNLLISFVLTLLAYAVLYFCAYLISLSMNLSIPYLTIAVFISVANILSFLPISVAGIGTRDASLIYLFAAISLNKEYAIVFSMLFFFVFFLCGGMYGFIAYTIKPVDIRKIFSKNKE